MSLSTPATFGSNSRYRLPIWRRIRQGQQISIRLPDGKRVPARISFVSPLLDKDTRTARVVASVDNRGDLLQPGGFVTADVPAAGARRAVVVPQSALQTVESDTVVFVRTDEGFERASGRDRRTGRRASRNHLGASGR